MHPTSENKWWQDYRSPEIVDIDGQPKKKPGDDGKNPPNPIAILPQADGEIITVESFDGSIESVWSRIQYAKDTREDMTEDTTKDVCTRGLIRATDRGSPCNHDEEVENNAKGGDSEDD